MKEKFIIFLLVFSLTVNVAALITMGYFWGKSERRGGTFLSRGELPPRGGGLSLNNGQVEKMRNARMVLLKEIAPFRDELMTKRRELANFLTLEKPDRRALKQKLREINDLQFQTQTAVIDNLLKEKEFLNPGQQKQYSDFICNRLCQGRCAMGKGPKGQKGYGMGRRPGEEMEMGRGRRQGRRMGW